MASTSASAPDDVDTRDKAGQAKLPLIEPLPARWDPAADPRSIKVPGLDTSASVRDQIEQIEQLITIKLQNIDANFARVQQILSTRILPAVKRYAINTEPVRDSAKFWVSFFEQAAQVRIPTSDDISTLSDNLEPGLIETSSVESSSSSQATPAGISSDETKPVRDTAESNSSFDPSLPPSDSSFLPAAGAGAVSSTPMARSFGRSRSKSRSRPGADAARQRELRDGEDAGDEADEAPSWAVSASLESPLDRLDRGLRSLRDDDEPTVTGGEPQRRVFVPDKGKTPVNNNTLLQNVLSKNLLQHHQQPSFSKLRTSPLKIAKSGASSRTTTPRRQRNPYIPTSSSKSKRTGGKDRDWDGIVDLRSPRRAEAPRGMGQRSGDEGDGSSEDDLDDLPPGMSPPITMDFARLPRSRPSMSRPTGPVTSVRLMQSPLKDAAKRIGSDILGSIERSKGLSFQPPSREYVSSRTTSLKPGFATGEAIAKGVGRGITRRIEEESASSAPSVPSLSAYSRHAMGIESSTDPESPSLTIPGGTVDASLERMMRQVGLTVGESSRQFQGDSFDDDDSFDLEETGMHTPPPGSVFSNLNALKSAAPAQEGDDDSDSDSSSDSDGEGVPGAPSAAFLMASSRAAARRMSDDSIGSSNRSSDSFEDEAAGADAPVHPFARAQAYSSGLDYDESFDESREGEGEEEPTVFGARLVASAIPKTRGSGELRLLGRELLSNDGDTDTIGPVPAQPSIPETPTPWGGNIRTL